MFLEGEGWVTADGVLSLEHDAANFYWGNEWRMPTMNELSALKNKCDWTWTTMNGVNGHVVRGRGDYASNSIFLPAAGCGNSSTLDNFGSLGYYWSSVSYLSSFTSAWFLRFGSVSPDTISYTYRNDGLSLRPVQVILEK